MESLDSRHFASAYKMLHPMKTIILCKMIVELDINVTTRGALFEEHILVFYC